MRPAVAILALGAVVAMGVVPGRWAMAASPAPTEETGWPRPIGRRVALAPRLLLQETPGPVYVPPGASPESAPPESTSVTERWWFWAAIGGVVVATVAIILIAGRAPSAPGSTLGNMEAFGGQ